MPAFKLSYVSKRRLNLALVGVVIFLCLFFLFQNILVLLTNKAAFAFDFRTYWSSGKAILENFNPYSPELRHYSFAEYLNPPLFALLMVPFALLPFEVAQIIWFLLSLSLLVIACRFTVKLAAYSGALFLSERSATLVLIGIATLCYPVFSAVKIGELGVVLYFLTVGALLAQVRGKSLWGGAMLGLAITLKITPLPLLAFTLWLGWYRFSIVAILTFLLTQAAAATYSPTLSGEYWFSFFPTLTNKVGHISLSLPGLASQVAPPLLPPAYILAGLAVLLPFALTFKERSPHRILQGFSLLFCGLTLALPVVEDHYLVWLLLPLLQILDNLLRQKQHGRLALYGLLVLLLWKPYELGGIAARLAGLGGEEATNMRLFVGRAVLMLISLCLFYVMWRDMRPGLKRQ